MTDTHHDRLWMTPLLNRIADVAGEEAAIAIARAKPGERVYIPEEVAADHWLTRTVGAEAAEKIASAFGSQKLFIPQAIAGDKRRRAAAIADLIGKGYSTNRIARTLGVSPSTVAEHKRKHPENDLQMKLF